MIYIASPYTHHLDAVKEKRFLLARAYANKLMLESLTCFSPIAYGHQFHFDFGHSATAEAWRTFNMHMLEASHRVHVLQIPGWEESEGIEQEINHAMGADIPVEFIPAYEVPTR